MNQAKNDSHLKSLNSNCHLTYVPYLVGRLGASTMTSTVQNGGEFSKRMMGQKLFWANFWRRRKQRGIYGAFHFILVD